ncbi:MAG: ribosomal protein S18-alanine N-acetyltransferase [Euryarchaeota archaeon]|nr:ribosomal protein S18-alanine N-acetyltransferase [Euryarchaeota archaeon]
MEVKIRQVRSSDLFRVIEIEYASFKDAYAPFLLLELYETCYNGFLVAEIDEMVVGYAIGISDRNHGRLISIAVDPKYRKRGAGSALMRAILEQLKQIGAKEVMLEVREGNTEAIELYLSFGFEKKGRMKSYYSDGEDAIIMEKKLI